MGIRLSPWLLTKVKYKFGRIRLLSGTELNRKTQLFNRIFKIAPQNCTLCIGVQFFL